MANWRSLALNMPSATQKSMVVPSGLPPGAVLRLLRPHGGLPGGAVLRPLTQGQGNRAHGPAAPIGATETKTGRTVLQQSPRPEVNQAAATAEHPAIKERLTKLIAGIQGAKLTGAREEKDPERVGEKIDGEGQSPRTVRDYSGFRIGADSTEAKDKVVAGVRGAFEVPDEQDEWEKGNPETGFHGHTLQVREKASPVTHEVQVLPREVAEHADSRHGMYEKARDGNFGAKARLKRLNEEDWRTFKSRDEKNAEPKFKFGSTQANIPGDSEASGAIKTAQQKIAAADRAGDTNDAVGGLVNDHHVTVRYGLKNDDLTGIKNYLSRQKPFEARLGKTQSYPASEHSDGAAPIVAPVDAPELRQLEAELDRHGEFAARSFPEYKPHATIAYVQPASAKKYEGMNETDGKKFTVASISISDRNGKQTEVPLLGGAQEADARAGRGRWIMGRGDQRQESGDTLSSAEPGEGAGGGERPGPVSAPQRWRAGKQTTPVEAQHPDGSWEAGTLRHWSPGYNGLPPQGRVETASGKMLRGVAARALRPAMASTNGSAKPIGPLIDGDVAKMVREEVKAGRPVKIFTRRVSEDRDGATRKRVGDWTERNLGARLPITDMKDRSSGAIYDDSSNVEHNTGRILAKTTNPGDRGKPMLVDLDGTLAKEPEKHGFEGSSQRSEGRGRLLRRWRTA
jgi:hypothetical protein